MSSLSRGSSHASKEENDLLQQRSLDLLLLGRDLAAPVLRSAGVGDCVVRVPILSSPEGQMSVKDQTTALVKLLAAAGQST